MNVYGADDNKVFLFLVYGIIRLRSCFILLYQKSHKKYFDSIARHYILRSAPFMARTTIRKLSQNLLVHIVCLKAGNFETDFYN